MTVLFFFFIIISVSFLFVFASSISVQGIEWTYRSKAVRNIESARVSVPPQLQPDPLAPLGSGGVTWRTDLFATEAYWYA